MNKIVKVVIRVVVAIVGFVVGFMIGKRSKTIKNGDEYRKGYKDGYHDCEDIGKIDLEEKTNETKDNKKLTPSQMFVRSIQIARECGVPENEILHNEEEINNFFTE